MFRYTKILLFFLELKGLPGAKSINLELLQSSYTNVSVSIVLCCCYLLQVIYVYINIYIYISTYIYIYVYLFPGNT